VSRSGFTLIELIIVVALIGIIVSVAIPGWLNARVTGNETSAVTALRAINNAEASYASVCGDGAYAVLFPTLGVAPPGSSLGFLSPDLTGSDAPVKSGYRFSLAPGAGASPGRPDCHGVETQTAYYATAVPATPGSSGTRGFATSQERDIWQGAGGVAPSEPFGPSDTVSRVR
jgi:prepilin-type N-terminal cleavage/methylation domain-containing protein